jgi:peptidoglycan/xylan/chitin deacetylase (PgdA/CDA1 family)
VKRYAKQLAKAAMSTLYYTRGHLALAPMTRGVGAILMLHQVLPGPIRPFDPNAMLRVTPEFLEQSIEQVRRLGLETVSLDEAHRRLVLGDFERPFVSYTLDDGYCDNLENALPVFRKHGVPLCIYVPSCFPDGDADLWWLGLEQVIEAVDQLSVRIDGTMCDLASATPQQKIKAFETIYWWLRRIDEHEARRVVGELGRGIGVNLRDTSSRLLMNWEEIRSLAADPLVTIGAHTVNHFALGRLPEAAAAFEIEEGTNRLERELGKRPQHLSFPYGSADAAGPREFRLAREQGFKTAVTTRKGLLFAEHGEHLCALPRLSLNGEFAQERYLSVLLSGLPFALANRFKKLNVG